MPDEFDRFHPDLWRGFSAVIIGPRELEKLAIEIRVGDDEFANIFDERPHRELIVYPRLDGQPWRLPLEDTVTYLQHANHMLTAGIRDESCIVCSEVIDPPQ